jgi:hypothetical protein
VRLDQVATAAAAPKADGTKKQPNIFAAFGAKVPAKKSKEIELREKKDTAALLSTGVRLCSASLPASSKNRKQELGINDVAVNTDVSDRQKRLDHEAVRGFIFESSWLSIKRSRAPVAGRWPLLLLFYAHARLCPGPRRAG